MKRKSLLILACALIFLLAGTFQAFAAAPELEGITFTLVKSFADQADRAIDFNAEDIKALKLSSFVFNNAKGEYSISSFQDGLFVVYGGTPFAEFGSFGSMTADQIEANKEATGVAFYFKNLDMQDVEIGISGGARVNGGETEEGYALSGDIGYVILIGDDGEITKEEAMPNSTFGGQGTVFVPAEFSGYVLYPFSGLYNQGDDAKRAYDPETDVWAGFGYVVGGTAVNVAYGDTYLFTGDLDAAFGPEATPTPAKATPTKAPTATATVAPTPAPDADGFPVLGYVGIAVGVIAVAVVVILVAKKGKKPEGEE